MCTPSTLIRVSKMECSRRIHDISAIIAGNLTAPISSSGSSSFAVQPFDHDALILLLGAVSQNRHLLAGADDKPCRPGDDGGADRRRTPRPVSA
jgi:hypothetical protein